MPAPTPSTDAARLHARPPRRPPAGPPPAAGTQPLGLGGSRDGFLHVPAGLDPDRPAPLLVALHGAGSSAAAALAPLARAAEAAHALVLAPDSRGRTWDVIVGGFGPDVAFLDAALEHVFARVAVDPARLVLAGFSDGASYALSLGLANGDLLSHLVAFSPGFQAAPALHGRPAIFVSHGTHDRVLPIERCSRRLVPALRRAGYDVRYDEFDGGHEVPEEIVLAAGEWLLADPK